MECLAYLFAQNQIVVVHGIVSDGPQLGHIYLAVLAQYGFIGGNLAVILEVAAMNNRQRKLGYNSALEFTQQMDESMAEKTGSK